MKKTAFLRMKYALFILLTTLTLGACGMQSQSVSKSNVNFEELNKTGELELSYASQFSVTEYGEYSMISIKDEGDFILVPEGKDVPYNLPEGTVVLQQPLDRTYLVSTSAMDLVREVGGLSNIRLSGTKEEDWTIEAAQEAMADGNILYAGKYSAPDYELILSEGCNLAIENTMILHSPDVKEKLEELGIPVLIERSSYEEHPLGRLEWIKLYGLLFGKKEEAINFYDKQLQEIDLILNASADGTTTEARPKIAYFHVNSNGVITVRKPNDYISKMIAISGGEYALADAFVDSDDDNSLSTMNMQMEDFYLYAKDADILIYNSTIEGELYSIDDLIEKNSLFKDFKAVQNKKVYCTGKNFFQEGTGITKFIVDMNLIINGIDSDFYYIKKLE